MGKSHRSAEGRLVLAILVQSRIRQFHVADSTCADSLQTRMPMHGVDFDRNPMACMSLLKPPTLRCRDLIPSSLTKVQILSSPLAFLLYPYSAYRQNPSDNTHERKQRDAAQEGQKGKEGR
jgi:hypothetical protein